jgi:hypothetical protein
LNFLWPKFAHSLSENCVYIAQDGLVLLIESFMGQANNFQLCGFSFMFKGDVSHGIAGLPAGYYHLPLERNSAEMTGERSPSRLLPLRDSLALPRSRLADHLSS